MTIVLYPRLNNQYLISYFIPRLSPITLTLYSAEGRVIKRLVSKYQLPVYYESRWDGCEERGQRVKSDFYFLKLASNINF